MTKREFGKDVFSSGRKAKAESHDSRFNLFFIIQHILKPLKEFNYALTLTQDNA